MRRTKQEFFFFGFIAEDGASGVSFLLLLELNYIFHLAVVVAFA